jgi:hypothetical protein
VKLLGRFFNSLLVYKHNTRHHHRLGFRARFRQTTLDEQLIYSLTFHRIILSILWNVVNHGFRRAVLKRT